MTWWQWLILILIIFIDNIINYGRKIRGGVHINDFNLANDEQFVSEVAESVEASIRRQMKKDLQDRMQA